jgi:hypothetical protein
VVNDASNCLRSATAVHIKVERSVSGHQLTADVEATSSGNGFGTVKIKNIAVQFVDLHGNLYLKAGSDFWSMATDAGSAAQLAGIWVQPPASLGVNSEFQAIIDYRKGADFLTSQPGASSNMGATRTPDGRSAVKITNVTGDLYVSAVGPPCPLYLIQTGANTDSQATTVSDYGAPLSITPPPDAVDLSQAGASPTP